MQKSYKQYYVYIVTNSTKSTLYTGVTNNLSARIIEHWDNKGDPVTFAGRYFCHNLIYYETYTSILNAIQREKEIKKWSRGKKEDLIKSTNPDWLFLNTQICGKWPPNDLKRRLKN